MGTRLSARLVRPLLATSVLLVSSGCLSLLDIDEGSYSESDGSSGRSGGSDDGGGDDGGRASTQGDATTDADDDDGPSLADGGSADASVGPPAACDEPGWHPDCTFGTYGIYQGAVNAFPAGQGVPVMATTTDDAGTVIVIFSTGTGAELPWLVTVSPSTGPATVQIASVADVEVLRALPDAGLATLLYVDGGTAAAAILGNDIVPPIPTISPLDVPLAFLDTSSSTWTALAVNGKTTGVLTMSLDGGGSASFQANTGGSIQATEAIEIGTEAYFAGTSAAGQAFEAVDLATGATIDRQCQPDLGRGFDDLVAVGQFAVAVAPTNVGFDLRYLFPGGCRALTTANLIDGGDASAVNTVTGDLSLAHGPVGSQDSVAVIAPIITDGGAGNSAITDTLYVAHLVVQVDGGALSLTSAPGARSDIFIGPDMTVGPPALAGGKLYVPLTQVVEADGGDAGPSYTLQLLRLAYR